LLIFKSHATSLLRLQSNTCRAPLVDQFGSQRFGYRKSWIVPLQTVAALLLMLTSLLDPGKALAVIVFLAFLANVITAMQDVATDALAIDLLTPEERGAGNGMQIAGYRMGMIIGGGVLLMVFDRLGWGNTFLVLGMMLLAGLVPVGLYREPPHRVYPSVVQGQHHYATLVLDAFRRPHMGWWLVVLLTYKAGDALGSAMLRPFLIDRGLQLAEIGWMLGTVGFSAGLIGAVVGGGLINLFGRTKSLVVFGLLHTLCMGLYALPAAGVGPAWFLYGFCATEYFAGSMASVALTTHMMDRSRLEAAATDYTLQASMLAMATSAVGSISGFVAESVGYTMLFVVAAVLGVSGVGWRRWSTKGNSLDAKHAKTLAPSLSAWIFAANGARCWANSSHACGDAIPCHDMLSTTKCSLTGQPVTAFLPLRSWVQNT
jgi:PAT family beta-lactamase induction signal transducer AmpG